MFWLKISKLSGTYVHIFPTICTSFRYFIRFPKFCQNQIIHIITKWISHFPNNFTNSKPLPPFTTDSSPREPKFPKSQGYQTNQSESQLNQANWLIFCHLLLRLQRGRTYFSVSLRLPMKQFLSSKITNKAVLILLMKITNKAVLIIKKLQMKQFLSWKIYQNLHSQLKHHLHNKRPNLHTINTI